MELVIAPLVEHFKKCFGKVFLINFASTWANLLKHCISTEFLLIEAFVQVALQKKLCIAPFAERFQTVTLGKSHR